MKDKLTNLFGTLGIVVYFILSAFICVLPFVMIGAPFWLNLIFFAIVQFFPLSSVIFWIWGLSGAMNGPQDFYAYAYYALFVLLFIPFFIGVLRDVIVYVSDRLPEGTERKGKVRIGIGSVLTCLQILSAIGNLKSGYAYSIGFDTPALFLYDLFFYISSNIFGIVGIILLASGLISYFASRKRELEASAPVIRRDDFYRAEQKSTDEKPSPESADMPPVRQHKTRPQNRTSPILVVAIIVLFALNIFQFVSSRASIAELKALVYELHGLELIEATEAKPTITPSTSKPADTSSVPEPYTGYIFKNLQADLTAPLTIETEGECGFYVILDPIELTGTFHGKYPESNYDAWKQMEAQEESYIKLYIRSNSLHKFKVPPGEYEVYYATGKSWQGFSDLFGPKTIYYKYADTFTFETTDAGYDAVTVKLISPDITTTGIIEINSSDFPK